LNNKVINFQNKKDDNNKIKIKINNMFLPITVRQSNLSTVFSLNKNFNKVLAIVIGTKPDFYKQAPLLLEAKREKLPAFIISTGQHYDNLLGYGIKEFNLNDSIVCDLNRRGD
jgi:hypothetical protein